MTTTPSHGIDAQRLGRWLRHRRLELGMTQQQVADATAMTLTAYQRVELGGIARLPAPLELSALAHVLQTERRYLLDLAGYFD